MMVEVRCGINFCEGAESVTERRHGIRIGFCSG